MNKLLSLCALLLTACTTMPEHCNPNRAYGLGGLDAKKWDSSKAHLSMAPRCDGEYSETTFTEDYNMAYTSTLKNQCKESSIKELGAVDAAALEHAAVNTLNIELCKAVGGDVKKLSLIYSNSFQKNLCDVKNAGTRGAEHARTMIEADASFSNKCPQSIRPTLKTKYISSYKSQIVKSCGPVELTKKAINDVKERKKLQETVDSISFCPAEIQTNAVLVYQTAFAREEDRMHAANESRKQDEFRSEQLRLTREQNQLLEDTKRQQQEAARAKEKQ